MRGVRSKRGSEGESWGRVGGRVDGAGGGVGGGGGVHTGKLVESAVCEEGQGWKRPLRRRPPLSLSPFLLLLFFHLASSPLFSHLSAFFHFCPITLILSPESRRCHLAQVEGGWCLLLQSLQFHQIICFAARLLIPHIVVCGVDHVLLPENCLGRVVEVGEVGDLLKHLDLPPLLKHLTEVTQIRITLLTLPWTETYWQHCQDLTRGQKTKSV